MMELWWGRNRGWLLGCALLASACQHVGNRDYSWLGGSSRGVEGKGALRVRWRKELTGPTRDAYRPVENAVAAIDEQHGRIYVGAASGRLHALTFDGEQLYYFELHEPIECEPALDVDKDELYVANERAEIFALQPSTGKIRWKVNASAAVRRRPVLYKDALYVITEDDGVDALSRSDGSLLWSYRRERSEGFLVAGHAGILLQDGVLYTSFNDGMVVALDALDGRPRWERDTSQDVPEAEPGRPRYVDADATPVRIGDIVFAASFAGGLYALDANNGSVLWREPEWTGITGLAASSDAGLIAISADRGVARFDPELRAARWVKTLERGSFGTPEVTNDVVVLGDSRGSLIALRTDTGDEVGRIEAGHGFAARTAVAGKRGFVVTNGGVLLAVRLRN